MRKGWIVLMIIAAPFAIFGAVAHAHTTYTTPGTTAGASGSAWDTYRDAYNKATSSIDAESSAVLAATDPDKQAAALRVLAADYAAVPTSPDGGVFSDAVHRMGFDADALALYDNARDDVMWASARADLVRDAATASKLTQGLNLELGYGSSPYPSS